MFRETLVLGCNTCLLGRKGKITHMTVLCDPLGTIIHLMSSFFNLLSTLRGIRGLLVIRDLRGIRDLLNPLGAVSHHLCSFLESTPDSLLELVSSRTTAHKMLNKQQITTFMLCS
jgi:hypothetical protein